MAKTPTVWGIHMGRHVGSRPVNGAHGSHNGDFMDCDAAAGMEVDPHWPGNYSDIR